MRDDITGVIIPIREADAVLRPRALQLGLPWRPRVDLPLAHVTVLAPFVRPESLTDGIHAELRAFFADVTDFEYTLESVSAFPGNGIAYLPPEPAEVFRRLTRELHHRFPEFPPYDGEFDDVVPHVTVPLLPAEGLPSVRRQLRDTLPLTGLARDACLVHLQQGELRVLAEFPFGSTAA